ncbi:MAG: tRNA pseudouridine(55) synthase TruB [Chloroflexi bacterium]|nr:tRNA pseudouridine(55) synthase TruB [Chloroflexota bacterium]
MASDRTGGPAGILLIDKPGEWTSHDVVARARRLCGQRRIGHTGTLDPMATGLLVLCLGRATRMVEYLAGHDKRYEGEIALGVVTATDDAEGKVLSRRPIPALDDAVLRALEARFSGQVLQVPPAYSAIKVEGKRAYAVARKGGAPALEARMVVIRRIELRVLGGERLAISVECGAGTYIRSLARDIGERLGCGAHLAALRRTRAGAFDVAGAISLEELAEVAGHGGLEDLLLPGDEALVDRPAALLGSEHAHDIVQGKVVAPAGAADRAPLVRIYDGAGSFIGTGSIDDSGRLKALKVLADMEKL